MCPLDVSMHWTVTMSIQNYANEMTRYYRFISYHVIIRLSINREQLKYIEILRLSDNRKTKEILTQQKNYKHPRCLYSEIEANAYSMKLDLNEITIKM